MREFIYDANGSNPVEIETVTVQELITFDLAKRNHAGQASFTDFVSDRNWREELAFQRDGTPRSY